MSIKPYTTTLSIAIKSHIKGLATSLWIIKTPTPMDVVGNLDPLLLLLRRANDGFYCAQRGFFILFSTYKKVCKEQKKVALRIELPAEASSMLLRVTGTI